MNEYWVVTDKRNGRVIAQCSDECDAKMLFEFYPDTRSYHKQKFILDQVITITSTTDKELPGQQGLPAAKEKLTSVQLQQEIWLPESKQIPVNAK